MQKPDLQEHLGASHLLLDSYHDEVSLESGSACLDNAYQAYQVAYLAFLEIQAVSFTYHDVAFVDALQDYKDKRHEHTYAIFVVMPAVQVCYSEQITNSTIHLIVSFGYCLMQHHLRLLILLPPWMMTWRSLSVVQQDH